VGQARRGACAVIKAYVEEGPTYVPLDESAALQWAIKHFRNNSHYLKVKDPFGEWLTYNKQLLNSVRTIPWGDKVSIVVPDGAEAESRMDYDDLEFVGKAREDAAIHGYLLAIAAALIDKEDILPDPLKKFVIEFLRNPSAPRPGRGRRVLTHRDFCISYTVRLICMQWQFAPTRNETTEGASAISIVKRALEEVGTHLTEAAITKIWNKSYPKKAHEYGKEIETIE
jgi:hypothetical protein